MKEQIFGLNRRLFFILIVLAVFRLWLGLKTDLFFVAQSPSDDALLIDYAYLVSHFSDSTNSYALAKHMGFPFFLAFVRVTGLPYTFWVTVVWMLSAVLAARLSGKLIPEGRFRGAAVVAVFLFILYSPAAFDIHVGIRLYRNSVMAPAALLYFFSLLNLVLPRRQVSQATQSRFNLTESDEKSARLAGGRRAGKRTGSRARVIFALITGCLLAWNYYLSENGIWLLPPTLIIIGWALGARVFKALKAGKEDAGNMKLRGRLSPLLIPVLPLVVLIALSLGYKTMNYAAFGVFETNTRVAGEPGRFVSNIYKIGSDERTGEIWAPTDAIEAAFDASPTLGRETALRETILTDSLWYNDIRETPIKGDHLTWVLIDALEKTGLWKNHRETDAFFRQVNEELEAAFADGSLKEDSSFRPFSAAGGLTADGVRDILPLMWQGIKSAVYYDAYAIAENVGYYNYSEDELPLDARRVKAEYITNLFIDNGYGEDENGVSFSAGGFEYKVISGIQRGILAAFKIFGAVAFVLACAGLVRYGILALRRRTRTEKLIQSFLYALAMLLTAFAVAFGIAWFAQFFAVYPWQIAEYIHFYAICVLPCVLVFDVLGISGLLQKRG